MDTRGFVRPIAVTILLLVSAHAASAPSDNDAGLGRDAGNTPALADTLPRYGRYTANLTSHNDSDWFRVLNTIERDPVCASLNVSGNTHAYAQLVTVFDNGANHSTRGRFWPASLTAPGAYAAGGLVAPTLDHVLVGVTPAPNKPGNGNPQRPGIYNFSIRAYNVSDLLPQRALVDVPGVLRLTGLDQNDGGSGTDAGNNAQGAVRVRPGCFAGTLDGLAGQGALVDTVDALDVVDGSDFYAFEGGKNNNVTLSLATPDTASRLRLDLRTSNGTTLASAPAGGAATYVKLPRDDTYYLVASLVVDGVPVAAQGARVPYLAGLAIEGDPGDGCRPTCLTMAS